MRLQRKTRTAFWAGAVATIVIVLSGCSAGGDTTSGGTTCTTTSTSTTSCTSTPTATPSVSATLTSSTVTAAAPVTVTATLLDAAKAPVSGAVVNFSVSSTIGSLSATSALTDSSGHASVVLSPASATTVGADVVTVSSTVAGTAVTSTVGYQTSSVTASISSITTDQGTGSASALSAYGQSDLTLTLAGVTQSAPATVTLTSACVALGKATISPSTASATSATLSFVYKDSGGCGSVLASDTVTATVTGATATPTTLSIFLTSPVANSITFNSASPSTIYLKGSGYVESSQVSFKVVDTAGNPLPGQAVTLNLSTFAGGVLLDQQSTSETKTSDANGLVTAIVNSGTVPTPERVIATLANSGISTVSSNLAIVTGLPSQLNFSLSQQTINIEGGDYDGTTNIYTVLAADRSGNPVPDGTSVIFWAEGGQIEGSAVTATSAAGISSATANFVSAAPRPADGRVTILAYALGEESFIDLNGNNVWDAGEPFQDLGDVVKDTQFDNIYDAANDEFVSLSLVNSAANNLACSDFSSTYPQFAVNQTTLNVTIPSRAGTCDATWSGKTYVRRATETVLSTSTEHNLWLGKADVNPGSGLDATCTVVSRYIAPPALGSSIAGPFSIYDAAGTSTGGTTWYTGTANGANVTAGSVSFIVADTNTIRLNPMPAGTTITVASQTDGMTVSVLGGTPVPSTSSATTTAVSYKFTTATSGTFAITYTTPKGLSTTYGYSIVEGARPSTCSL